MNTTDKSAAIHTFRHSLVSVLSSWTPQQRADFVTKWTKNRNIHALRALADGFESAAKTKIER